MSDTARWHWQCYRNSLEPGSVLRVKLRPLEHSTAGIEYAPQETRDSRVQFFTDVDEFNDGSEKTVGFTEIGHRNMLGGSGNRNSGCDIHSGLPAGACHPSKTVAGHIGGIRE